MGVGNCIQFGNCCFAIPKSESISRNYYSSAGLFYNAQLDCIHLDQQGYGSQSWIKDINITESPRLDYPWWTDCSSIGFHSGSPIQLGADYIPLNWTLYPKFGVANFEIPTHRVGEYPTECAVFITVHEAEGIYDLVVHIDKVELVKE